MAFSVKVHVCLRLYMHGKQLLVKKFHVIICIFVLVVTVIIFSSDIDECSQTPSICDHHCINNNGSFECGCRNGYMLDADLRTCTGMCCMCPKDCQLIHIVFSNWYIIKVCLYECTKLYTSTSGN